MAAALRFLAEGGYQNGVGQDCFVGMAQPTVSVVLSEVFQILEEALCAKWISLKMSEEEKTEARLYFLAKSKIPGIVMCVDGTHIKIAKPTGDNTHLFYNRKGFYSLNAMIVSISFHYLLLLTVKNNLFLRSVTINKGFGVWMLHIQGRVMTRSFGETAIVQNILKVCTPMGIEIKDYLVRMHFLLTN